ncbi:hypothetical protein M3Y97_00401100 [Aphelenchoides bicaudatus]|nr:hypothetical protein M3Y97_00401100 [Aphelenchoides bicaudatus]
MFCDCVCFGYRAICFKTPSAVYFMSTILECKYNMSDTEDKPKPAEDLRRSKRNKFHLDIVAVLSRRSPVDFRRSINRSDPSSKSSIKPKLGNRRSLKQSSDVSAPVLEPMFSLDDDKNLVKIESEAAEDLVKASNNAIENGVPIPLKRSKLDETNSVSSIENSAFPLIGQKAIKVESKPAVHHKSIRCYKCLMTFKTNAGLGKHVKTCKKYADSTKAPWSTRLPDLSNSFDSSSVAQARSSTNNTPSNSSSSNVIKKESDSSDSLEDSNELDMPVLTPECSFKPRKNRSIAEQEIRSAGSPSIQEKRRMKRTRAQTSSLQLHLPFDIKKALSLKLEIPPVPTIIVESPIDKSPEYYFCAKCPYKANDKNLLLLHEGLHDSNNPRAYQCNFCSYSCCSANALHYHLNLHAPALSPNTATNLRKHMIANKRNGVHNIAPTSTVVQRLEQVQIQQQRLVSIIKRSGGDDNAYTRIRTRLPLPTTKFYTCKKCAFRTERKENLIFHSELHGIGLLYACKHCDYSSNVKNVTEYHMRNHHFDTSLTTHATNLAIGVLKKKAKEMNRSNSVPAEVTLAINYSIDPCTNVTDFQTPNANNTSQPESS